MSQPHSISRDVARRFLAHHHFLAPARSVRRGKAGVRTVFDRLGSIQFDPIDVAGRNHDLVLLSRVRDYRREMTDELLYGERALFETHNKMLSLVPTDELPWYRIAWDRARREHTGGAFDEHSVLVEELLERIRMTGPMSSTDVPPRAAIAWSWRPTNPVRALLEALWEAGILGLVRREGSRRIYDLVERLFPATLLAMEVPPREQFRHKLLSRYRAHGLLGATGSYELWAGTTPRLEMGLEDGLPLGTPGRRILTQELLDEGAIHPVRIDGVRTIRHVVAAEWPVLEAADREVAAGRPPGGRDPTVAFLAPLDPLVWDREFVRQLYDFDYLWEVYVPAAKRRWGYYVLPMLLGDRLVGRIELRVDRRADALQVLGLWWEAGFEPLEADGFVEGFADALEAHRGFAGVAAIRFPAATKLRPFVRAVNAIVSPGRQSSTGRRPAARAAPASGSQPATAGRRVASG